MAVDADPGALPVRRLTLYKHGVAFVERGGVVTGERVSLQLRAGDVNDVLKSLFVLDRRGGQVLGIEYDTQPDQAAEIAASPLTLSDEHALLDLLRALRGSEVTLTLGAATERQEIAGRVIGVEVQDDTPARTALVSLLSADELQLSIHRLKDVRDVQLKDERLRRDLRHLLDVSRRDESRRIVGVRLSPGEHDLALSYLQSSPTWRVSYRVVAERGPDGGTLLLQGWGLFDNHLEEDLTDVRVRLIAGQPISFIYDLATSRVPARRVVQDEARVAAGPVELERRQPRSSRRAGGQVREMDALAAEDSSVAYAAAAPMMVGSLAIEDFADQPIAATGTELGELFSYEVTTPVSVGRGQSALVPILSAQLRYDRELVFNERKLPGHPVAALRFANRTGLVLERGPVTIVEDGEYRGEAIVPFSPSESEVYLAFAVELGMTVKRTQETRTETAGVRIEKALLWAQVARLTETRYEVTSELTRDEVVTIEHPVRSETSLVDTREPDSRTAECCRWHVPCAGRGAASLTVTERREVWQQHVLLDLTYDALRQYLDRRWLDAATIDRVRALLEERQRIARNADEAGDLEEERDDLYRREEELRKNLAALAKTGEEATLRQRVFEQLRAAEERLGAIDEQIAALQQDSQQRQAALDTSLENLSSE